MNKRRGVNVVESFDDSVPIYQQIVEKIKKRILSGILEAGEKVKSVRELAFEMGVNPNTMQKALAVLEAESLLHSERTAGRYVTSNKEIIEKMKGEIMKKEVENFIKSMENLGYDPEQVIDLINQYVKELRKK